MSDGPATDTSSALSRMLQAVQSGVAPLAGGLGPTLGVAGAGPDALTLVLAALWSAARSGRSGGMVPAPQVYQEAVTAWAAAGWGEPARLPAALAAVTVDMDQAQTIVRALRECAPADLLGKFYVEQVRQITRRRHGQFWTPPGMAQLLAQWAIRRPSDYVLDPGFGSARLLAAAQTRLEELGALPQLAGEQIYGVELSPAVFLLGALNLLLWRPAVAHGVLRCADFIRPNTGTAPTGTPWREPGQPWQLPLFAAPAAPVVFTRLFDAVIANPPYTRYQDLPDAYKDGWATAMEQEFRLSLRRAASLAVYFLLQATRMLRDNGRLAFLVPTTLLSARYGESVRDFISRYLRLRAIITFGPAVRPFAEVENSVCVLLAEGRVAAPGVARLVEVETWPGPEPVLAAVNSPAATADYPWGRHAALDPGAGAGSGKWLRAAPLTPPPAAPGMVPLGEIATIKRGIETGANAFFVLTDQEVAQWGLDRRLLAPVLSRNRDVLGYLLTPATWAALAQQPTRRRWLLLLTTPVTPGTPAAAYVEHGAALGLPARTFLRRRPYWYISERRDPAPIYFTYLARHRARFIWNQAGVLALNVFLCVYPHPAIVAEETALKALLAQLNAPRTSATLRRLGRNYGGPTVKVEPRELDRLPVYPPLNLAPADRERLAGLYDRLAASTPATETTVKQDLDAVLAGIAAGAASG